MSGAPLVSRLCASLEQAKIDFSRGDLETYARRLVSLSAGLTLPVVGPQRERAVELKALYSLLNVVLDDEVDRLGSTAGLEACARRLSPRWSGPAGQGAVALLDGLLTQVEGALPAVQALLRFDLRELLLGLHYEAEVGPHRPLVSSWEYRRHVPMTASMKVLLDLDLALVPSLPPPVEVRGLRQGYACLTEALKLASDIGSLRRELVEEDSLNLIRILAAEAGMPAMLDGRLPAERFASAVEALGGAIAALRAESQARLADGEALLKATGVEVAPVLQTTRALIAHYARGADFH